MSLLDRARKQRDLNDRRTRERKAAEQQRVKEQASKLLQVRWGVNVPPQRWRVFDERSSMDSGRGRVWTVVEGVYLVYVRWWHGNPGDDEALFGVKRSIRIDRIDPAAPQTASGHHRDLVYLSSLAHLAELVDSRLIRSDGSSTDAGGES